jgi:predicted hydrocarbon binding protein
MMKHDKKIQRVAPRAAGVRDEDDEDDIIRNMTNLILNNKVEESSFRKANFLALDTAANTTSTNVMRSNAGKAFGDLGTKKLSNLDQANSMLMNPMIESFLTFNLNQNTTTVQTNGNVTAQFNN